MLDAFVLGSEFREFKAALVMKYKIAIIRHITRIKITVPLVPVKKPLFSSSPPGESYWFGLLSTGEISTLAGATRYRESVVISI